MTVEYEQEVARINAEVKRRQTLGVYSQPKNQLAIMDIKAKLLTAVSTIADHDKGKWEKLRAVASLRGLVKDIHLLPEPTEATTWHPNSHQLIKVRDEFFRRCGLGTPRQQLIRAVLNFVIMIYDYDRPYRDLIDWAKQELDKDWTPRGATDIVAADWSRFFKED
jgi:hypothetical protein